MKVFRNAKDLLTQFYFVSQYTAFYILRFSIFENVSHIIYEHFKRTEYQIYFQSDVRVSGTREGPASKVFLNDK